MRGGAAPLRGVGRVVEWNARVYSRVWQGSVITGFVTPLLFLLAIGVTLGGRIDDGGGLELPYAEFVAPGLLASTAMQVGIFESSFPVVAGLHWRRTFHAVLATPIALPALVIGRLLWVAVRITLACAAFLLVALAFGLLSSPLALLAVPAGVLAGTAFSAPMEAFAATRVRRCRLCDGLPARCAADDPLLGRLLPGRPASRRRRVARLDLTALPRDRALPGPHDRRDGAGWTSLAPGCARRAHGARWRPWPRITYRSTPMTA